MAQALAVIDIPVSPNEVWQLIGGFNSSPDWLAYIPKSELSEGGRVRHLANPNGETIVEGLEKFDNAARSYSYFILRTPFPKDNPMKAARLQEYGKPLVLEDIGSRHPVRRNSRQCQSLRNVPQRCAHFAPIRNIHRTSLTVEP
jgi:Polyketide cyclase / dehydrase and lipid transport